MDKLELHAATRQVLGKKVKVLRRNGITPAHIFGHGVESLPLQIDAHSLEGVLRRAGSTHLVSLTIDGAKRPRNVVVAEVQRRSISGELLHVAFYQVRMEEAITVEVPLNFVGESPVAKSKMAELLKSVTSVSVECMPGNIPTGIEVDISHLEEVGDSIYVRDVKVPEGVRLLANPDELIVRVYRPRAEVEAGVVEAAKVVEEEERKKE